MSPIRFPEDGGVTPICARVPIRNQELSQESVHRPTKGVITLWIRDGLGWKQAETGQPVSAVPRGSWGARRRDKNIWTKRQRFRKLLEIEAQSTGRILPEAGPTE
jgi:hypothetical protein